jgi:aspartyl-tRNA synthetase
MTYRSKYNGEISLNDVGTDVTVVGWVSKKRNLGSLAFIDLRDVTGIIQIMVPDNLDTREIRNEFVIQVKGNVAKKDVPNPNLKTGNVEIRAREITVLNKAKTPPLIIADETDALEEVRLKYRYLDLRRPVMQKYLITRAKIAEVTRNFLNKHHFIEIETPILTKSTPGGARDFLVPSRLHPGSFYALPQSPQTYKQLLMIGGFERYYQIARCFRDEDLRADRQPDFTQIDIETSFLTKDELLTLMEELVKDIFKETINYDLETPFRRLSYKEAMETYGSDKPDTRFGLHLVNIKGVFSKDSAHLFSDNKYVNALVIPNEASEFSRKNLDELNIIAKKYQLQSVGTLKFNSGEFTGTLAKLLTDKEKSKLTNLLNLKENDLVIVAFSNIYKAPLTGLGAIRLYFGEKLHLIDESRYDVLWVDRFPLFTRDVKTNQIVSEHHQFTMPEVDDIPLLDVDPEKALSQAYDIVINGNEAGGGSMRIYDQDLQAKIFKILGMSDEEVNRTFSFFIEALKYGTPPHGGIAFGLDRLAMLINKTDNIRDVIAFPKNIAGVSPMSGEPGEVTNEQLDELHIKVKED